MVSEQRVQEIQQASAQCTTDLAVVRVELEGLRAKISAPQSDLRVSHNVSVGGLLVVESPQGMFWGLKPKF